MANSQAMATSFKVDVLNGVHAFGTTVVRGGTGADTFKAALYLATASLGAGTTSYPASGELASGGGYTTGGVTFTWAAPTSTGTTGYSTPSASFVWAALTATGFDTVLIYNSSQSNKAISVHTFGSQTITGGTFTLTMPSNAAGTALIQFA